MCVYTHTHTHMHTHTYIYIYLYIYKDIKDNLNKGYHCLCWEEMQKYEKPMANYLEHHFEK